MSSTTALNQYSAQLLNLLLGAAHGTQLFKVNRKGKDVKSYALLGELAGTLISAILEQFHNATLIGSEAGDLTDQVTDELDTLVQALQIYISIHQ